MNIIFVSNKMTKARTLSVFQLCSVVAGIVLLSAFVTATLIVPADVSERKGVKALLPASLSLSKLNNQAHLDALAMQLGESQARLMRLDAMGNRLGKLAGVKEPPLDTKKPGQGGPQISPKRMTELQIQADITRLLLEIEQKSDYLGDVESALLKKNMQQNILPNAAPIEAAFNSSSYGWRVDPFTGNSAFHEGLDFSADMGSPIFATAEGIVTESDNTNAYGNLIKISHGSGLETRYAHCSELIAKVGDRVVKGQLIARVGSTGRSTGPHLHYEIRLYGAALDPRKYLN